jgi:hypothetical protein
MDRPSSGERIVGDLYKGMHMGPHKSASHLERNLAASRRFRGLGVRVNLSRDAFRERKRPDI